MIASVVSAGAMAAGSTPPERIISGVFVFERFAPPFISRNTRFLKILGRATRVSNQNPKGAES
jgi:hypothetical protein